LLQKEKKKENIYHNIMI